MVKWQGRERSSNVEDRRGAGGAGGGFNPFGRGGGGLGGGGPVRIPIGRGGGVGGVIGIIVVLGLIWLFTGQNPLGTLTGSDPTNSGLSPSQQGQPLPQAGQDELADFVGVIVKETENLWIKEFKDRNMTYTPPKVTLFSDAVATQCGNATAASGPFYCPNDQHVYIDLTFYDQLRSQFGAPGDFAQAYVLAHEIGHHVQNLTGVLPEFAQRRAQMSEEDANAYSVRVELQADCYAGVWGNYAGRQNMLENGDVEEAINAANSIGDDTLQRQMQGRAVPRTFTHGTSEQRMRWFQVGMRSGDPADCDTFSGSV